MSKKKGSCSKDHTLRSVGEFGLIARFASGSVSVDGGVALGIGDDTAALSVSRGRQLLATCDSQVEDVHFRFDWSSPTDIGRRAAAVNLSDIAAMGGTPRWALFSLAAAPDADADVLYEIFVGVSDELSTYDACVVGGNTASTSGPLVIDITLLGEANPERILRRSGAQPGDVVCVTGVLGNSRAGLSLLSDASLRIDDSALRAQALSAYRRPTPRIAVGQLLAASGDVTACMDISDGLAGDAEHISYAGDVALEIDIDRLPVSEAVRRVAGLSGESPGLFACRGGEDFELLFTMRRERVGQLVSRVRSATGIEVTAVGEVKSGRGVKLISGGRPVPESVVGFDHFKKTFF